jgi:hypothetical protein
MREASAAATGPVGQCWRVDGRFVAEIGRRESAESSRAMLHMQKRSCLACDEQGKMLGKDQV